jgi:hypothetical protein
MLGMGSAAFSAFLWQFKQTAAATIRLIEPKNFLVTTLS